LAKENMKLMLQNGHSINGNLSWQNAEQYSWQGFAYIEVPYIFNGKKQLIDQTDTLQYSLVLRVLHQNNYSGAIAITQSTRAKILGTDSMATVQTKTYTLLNGKEGNSWMSSGTVKNKAVQPVIKNEAELAAWDTRLKKLKIAGEQGTVYRKAVPEEECQYFAIPSTSISTETYTTNVANDNGEFDESRNKTLEEVIVVGKIKKRYEVVSICTEKETGGGNPFPPIEEGGGSVENENEWLLILSIEDQKKYPEFTKLVKGLRSYVATNKNVLDALMYYTELKEKEILEKLKFGKGPTIIIKDILEAYGRFNEFENYNILNIDASFVRGLEMAKLESTKQGTSFLLAVTILHEFVHMVGFLKE